MRFGTGKQGAWYGHIKVGGRRLEMCGRKSGTTEQRSGTDGQGLGTDGQRPGMGEDQSEPGGWRIGTSKQTFGSTLTGHGTNIQPVVQPSVQKVVQHVVSSIHTYISY